MTSSSFAALPGSARAPLTDFDTVGPVDADERIELTLLLRRRAELPGELVHGAKTVTRQQLSDRYGATAEDLAAVRSVLTAAGAEIVEELPGSRRVRIAGPAGVLQRIFGTELNVVRSPNPLGGRVQHRARSGELRVPAELDGIVLGVLGLDDRPLARAYVVPLTDPAAARVSYAPPALAGVYGFPPDTDGTGQTIAIIELGGGFAATDLDPYFQGLNLATPKVTAVGVDGAQNVPGKDPKGADGEVLLDIEVAGALAPKAELVVYFAPNTDQGFADAISTAVHATPTPVAVSISWGQCEDQWTQQSRAAMDAAFADAAALGVTVTVAAGDSGCTDAETDGAPHVDYPASSPNVLACGGTALHVDAAGKVSGETVWNDGASGGSTGGGVSDVYPLPDWQQKAGVGDRFGTSTVGRGVPDVAAVADPATGYQVRVDGTTGVMGGTSAVAPLWAALVARLAQSAQRSFGLLQPALYRQAAPGTAVTGFRDITSGDNGDYHAGSGWDACTGLGVPDGAALLKVLMGG